jgi:hypothetical protein
MIDRVKNWCESCDEHLQNRIQHLGEMKCNETSNCSAGLIYWDAGTGNSSRFPSLSYSLAYR